ncbi:MAG: Flp pilus assembly complex ATPase component TadA [Burkholderiales bacterium]|nr:Flp pilus assembly complex ATPase component TadA [Burkholderiales bacterium]
MQNDEVRILTSKGGLYQIPPSLYDYVCLTSDRKCYYNETYPDNPYVLNKIALFKAAKLYDESPIPLSSSELRALYDKTTKNSYESSELQKEITGIFTLAASKNASDVHIIVRKTECIVKLRVSGDLIPLEEYTYKHGYSLCKTIFMSMCDQAGKTFQPRKNQDARMKSVFLPESISGVRIGTRPTDGGFMMVCRLLKRTNISNVNLLSLGYEPYHIEILNLAISRKSGISIVAGPTNSGKSTILAMIIANILKQSNGSKNIITVENPVEYEISAITQIVRDVDGEKVTRELRTYANQTPVMADTTKKKSTMFAEAISGIMRLDPNVIMIGEIRDSGSLAAAIDSSMTGHQVWTTVHATSAIGIINRLLTVGRDGDSAVQKELICDASNVTCLMSQRLVKKLCPICSTYLIDDLSEVDYSTLDRIKKCFSNDLSGIKLRGKGCNECENGIAGLTVIAEIILCDKFFMDKMQTSPLEAETYWLKELNGLPMMMHGLIKVKRGEVAVEDLESGLEPIYIPKDLNIEYFKKVCGSNHGAK